MSIGSPPRTATEQDRALHARLLARDPVAWSELADLHLSGLAAFLRRVFSPDDPALAEDVATDLLVDLMRHPERYDPTRMSLRGYLRMAARRDFFNRIKSEQRHRQRLVPFPDEDTPGVEDSRRPRNLFLESAEDPADVVEQQVSTDAELEAILDDAFTPQEREILDLMLDDVRSTRVYAERLGITHLPPDQQRREVKRVKDRLGKRLRRLAPQVRRDG